LALGSRSFWTSNGGTDWDALSKTTCALPRQSPPAASAQTLTWWTATRTAITVTTAPWMSCARHISPARSCRSTSAPAGSDTGSHGRKAATDTAETSRGSLVIVAASSGSAAANAPSPALSTALAHHSRQ